MAKEKAGVGSEKANVSNTKSAQELESPNLEEANVQSQGSGIEAYLPANDEIDPPNETITEHWKKPPQHEVSIPTLDYQEETEEQFLNRLLEYQNGGGFGKHLDQMINERRKRISGSQKKPEDKK